MHPLTFTARHLPRRAFLKSLAASAPLALVALPVSAYVLRPKRLRVAAVITAFTCRSHSQVLLENFVAPYLFNGKWVDPGMDVIALYVDQFPEGELGREFAAKYNIPIHDSIRAALCAGTSKLAVDAVLSIGEHGSYPTNEKGQVEYPRKRFFDAIVEVFRENKRVLPLFSDKHLSFRWDWAKEMYDTARQMRIPLMAGSSVPLAQRRPPLDLPSGVRITEAVSIHAGRVESYDFHALEILQSMIDTRRGNETGVSEVQFLEGKALWKAAADGLWSPALAQAALDAEPNSGRPSASELIRPPRPSETGAPYVAHGLLVKYRDGTRGTVLSAATSGGTKWHFACQIDGESSPRATSFYVGPWDNRNLFKAFAHAIQTFFRNARAPWPIERPLLVTGILDAEMDSRFQGGVPVQTPQLAITYKPRDFRALREMGASWKILTENIPEPRGIDRGTSSLQPAKH